MCHDAFFLIMRIMHSEPNNAISHLRIIPKAPNKVIRWVVIWRVDTLRLFCFVAGVGGEREDSLKKEMWLAEKAKFNTSYLITS